MKARGRGGGGGEKQILREYGFKKTSTITDDPLLEERREPYTRLGVKQCMLRLNVCVSF